ncbi:serine/threonine protein kinase [Nonomuraea sp. NBC_00507]|uniref:serine/threonine-protein kinase n=1 Tax=Nonomuraea sp. NBC_00507 TaxID=2976002 RepID=UPI002E17B903
MEPVFDIDVLPLIAAYREICLEEASSGRAQRLGLLIVDLLNASGMEAALRGEDLPVIVFRHNERPFLMALSWSGEPVGAADVVEVVRTLHADSGDATVILLSMPGFEPQTPGSTLHAVSPRTLLWDRMHLESALCGLAAVTDLLAVGERIAFFEAAPYVTLTRLLADADDVPLPRMFTPDRRPTPWPVLDESHAGMPAQVTLVGEDGWHQPSGIAALDLERLVVVTGGGLIELNNQNGATSWIMQLSGCAAEPMVLPDGSVLAVCNNAVVRVNNGQLEPVAGGFSGDVRLLAGPDREPWVLSGAGPTYGTDQATLSLTRIGERVGDQHRFDVHFDADVDAAGWLERRRFFLAAAGHSAVVDLNRRSRVMEEDWIVSPHGYRAYLQVLDPHRVAIAAGNATGVGVTLWRTDVVTGVSEQLGDLVLNAVCGLCVAADGTGYLLGDVYGARRGPRDPWPVLIRLPGLRPPGHERSGAQAGDAAGAQGVETALQPAGSTSVVERPDPAADPYNAVRLAARGDRGQYALEPRPIDTGGQAEVFRARHKPSGALVAFKRLRSPNPNAVARMRREIEVARALGDNPHIMPVLDYSDRYEWFVMPLAQHTAATHRSDLAQPPALRDLVTAICEALRPAHAHGWIHRDLKPANLLNWDGVWTVGDWGLTRRPHGQTTNPDRTRVGAMLGTEGFAAPELSIDAHQAGPEADIYSIGQIIGWVLRGDWPQANTPLLPTDGPWRHVVWKATQFDSARRPATVDDLLDVIRHELDYDQPDTGDPTARLLAAANDGDSAAAEELFGVAMRNPADLTLYTDVLARLDRDAVYAAVAADRSQAIEVVRAMNNHLRHASQLTFDDAAHVIIWLHWIEVWAAHASDLDVLQVGADAVLAWDAYWDQWTPQPTIKAWMITLRGDAAAVVAGALRDHPDAVQHFAELGDNSRVDERIRRAVRPPRASMSDP